MLRKLVPDVVHDQALTTLPPSATVRQAARLMRTRHVGCVLVTTADGHLSGIFTERDMVCRVVADSMNPDKTQLGAVMTAKPDTASPDTSAIDALRRMHDGGYRHLPIVHRGRLVGIVSRRDFYGVEKAQLDHETSLWETVR